MITISPLRRGGRLLLLLGALASGCAGREADAPSRRAAVQPYFLERTAYRGWPDCYRFSNGTVDVVVVPAIGRVMYYGPVGGPNLLWENPELLGKPPTTGPAWSNFGGDKVWPWPQDQWPQRIGRAWPPPYEADQAGYRRIHIPSLKGILGHKVLALESPPLTDFGVTIVRELVLWHPGTGLSIYNKLIPVPAASGKSPVAAWTVTQLPPPDQIFARLLPGSTLPEGFKSLGGEPWQDVRRIGHHRGRDVLVMKPQTRPSKLGFDADVLAWRRGEHLLIQRSSFPDAWGRPDPRTPEPGERAQVWNNVDPPYVELEFTAPRAAPARGRMPVLRVTWEWHRVPPDEPPEAVAERLRR
jgi:hypothetical protein